MSEEVRTKKMKCFPSGSDTEVDMVRSEPLDVYMPTDYYSGGSAEKIYNFEMRPDDIWVVTYPKCGTTWMQEILWQMVNDLDAEKAANLESQYKVPFLEMTSILSQKFKEKKPEDKPPHMADSLAWADQMSRDRPRVIKSHMPLEFLPPSLLEKNKGEEINNAKACPLNYINLLILAQLSTYVEMSRMRLCPTTSSCSC